VVRLAAPTATPARIAQAAPAAALTWASIARRVGMALSSNFSPTGYGGVPSSAKARIGCHVFRSHAGDRHADPILACGRIVF
jgi:hypothetical protein